MKHLIISTLLFLAAFPASAQTKAIAHYDNVDPSPYISKQSAQMQHVMVKLIIESGTAFKKIKGSKEVRRDAKAVYYPAMLASIAPDADELGAMMTTDDNIVEVGGGTFYVASYTDDPHSEFSLRSFAEDAFSKMPYCKGDKAFVFTTQAEKTANPDELKTTVLLLNGKRVGIYNDYLKAGKSAIILGFGL